MSYGLKYNCDFDSKSASYTLEIYQKDFIGYEADITGGASAVVHTWDTDDPKAPIKGSAVTVNLINESGNITLADLYSDNDEEYKIKLIWHSVSDITLFEGFVVLTDSRELMVDYNHPISISANDNLGLLKDIPFNQAFFQEYIIFETEVVDLEGVADHTLIITSDVVLLPGDVISTTGTLSGVYHVTGVSGTDITVKENIVTTAVESVTMIVFRGDFYTLRTLSSFIKTCLLNTGLELNTQVFSNINEVTQDDTGCFLDQTLLDPQTFNNGSSWDDCYSVLTKILERFDCTLFQAKGMWNIIRWDELRDFDYAIPGFLYDSEFVFQNVVYLDESSFAFSGWNKFTIGLGETTQAETGLEQGIIGSYKLAKETFNYRQPEELLRNANLQQLGRLLNTYTVGSNTITEYEMPWWTTIPGSYTGTPLFFIRITTDNLGNEIDRAAVVANGAIESFPIQAAEGDRFSYSFSVITSDSVPGNTNNIFEIKIDDGSTVKYLDDATLTWLITRGYTLNVASGDNTNVMHNFEISGTIPYDGLLTVSLEDWTPSAETYYRDIRMDYTPMINQSTKIVGHTHNSEQSLIIKNNNEREISIDVSPRNSIAGTLFLDSLTGVLQDRATQWKRKPRTESLNLGEIATSENLFLRRTPRTLLEGNFYGLITAEQEKDYVDQANHLSLLSVCRYTYFPTHNFIFGRLEIDYSQNMASGTLYEMYKDTETDSDLDYVYVFQFLYESNRG